MNVHFPFSMIGKLFNTYLNIFNTFGSHAGIMEGSMDFIASKIKEEPVECDVVALGHRCLQVKFCGCEYVIRR